MNSPKNFEERLAAIADRIDGLPAEEQARLRGLVDETRARHAANETNIARAKEGLRVLQVTEELHDLNLELLKDAVAGFRKPDLGLDRTVDH